MRLCQDFFSPRISLVIKLAVENFQRDNNVPVTGVVSGTTTGKLLDVFRKFLKENDPQVDKAIEVLLSQINS
jgi:carboxyl-terminal processing protease